MVGLLAVLLNSVDLKAPFATECGRFQLYVQWSTIKPTDAEVGVFDAKYVGNGKLVGRYNGSLVASDLSSREGGQHCYR